MVRPPAVAGRFYPAKPEELLALIHQYTRISPGAHALHVRACLVPHAGYIYSGHVTGAVFIRMAVPQRILVLGVTQIDEELASALGEACPLLREDSLAHAGEHSIEVQLPFLQALKTEFTFVPLALGTARFEDLMLVGGAIGRVLAENRDVLLLTTSDLNHYEDDATTRMKDAKAIEQLLKMDARGLYDVCEKEEISMCGLGPAVAMLTALTALNATKAELARYATSGDIRAVARLWWAMRE